MKSQISTFDTVVIGGGIAGASLALSLAAKQKRVAVVASGPGASSVSSGSWDFGPIPETGDPSLEACVASEAWRSAYERVLVDWKNAPEAGELAEAAQAMQRVLAPDLEIALRFDRPWSIPTTGGRIKRTFGAQAPQAASDLAQLEGRRVAVLYSRSWRYRADLLTKSWINAARAFGKKLDLIPTEIDYEPKRKVDSPLPHVSARLRDDGELFSRFTQKVSEVASTFDAVMLPPLSLEDTFLQKLREALTIPVSECLATAEPNAGYRLHHATRAAFTRHGIELVSSTQIHASHSEGWLRELSVFTGSGWRALQATHFVLATGKYFGGGITTDWNGTRETVLGLPLFLDRVSPAFIGRPGTEWPRIGVWADEAFRPQTRPALPAFHNLRACGSVLGGVDFSSEGMGLGFMAFTGYRSGSFLT